MQGRIAKSFKKPFCLVSPVLYTPNEDLCSTWKKIFLSYLKHQKINSSLI